MSPVRLIAIAGGSGSGKSRLAASLHQALLPDAVILTLDHFYQDLSHLDPDTRAATNFDDPGTIDWPAVESALQSLTQRQPAEIPDYDFCTHTRRTATQRVEPATFLILDGLWPLTRPTIRHTATLRLFVDCPADLRLTRRIARDTVERGRSEDSIRRQCAEHVEPMHRLHVQPQAELADLVLVSPLDESDLATVLARLMSA
ncbi:uridine kinase [Haloferula luteola]|uniref:uridine/cytidine kinase n=1 Tax=Haloferula luteola TaxID=595692 RepID=A0A840UYR2_9BACT|nr:uridine-cytidine kinase [Haloferula luteola]MBB5350875.1 uridine kinase [Haloferula luteola]